MNPDSAPGAKVVFIYPWNGYRYDQEQASRHLKVGEAYTVERTHHGQSTTGVELVEVPGQRFNSVLFEDADKIPTPAEYLRILAPSVEYGMDSISRKAHAAALEWLAQQVEIAAKQTQMAEAALALSATLAGLDS